VLDYGETACTAYRNFGTKESRVVLALRPSPNGSVVRLSLVRNGKVSVAHHFPVTTNISDSSVKTTGLRFGSADHKGEVIWINFARPQLEGLIRTGEIAITSGRAPNKRFAPALSVNQAGDNALTDGRTLNQRFAPPPLNERFALPGIAGVLKALDTCNADLRNHWNIGDSGTAVVTPATALDPGKWANNGDYPQQAFEENASGIVGFVLLIDETGKPRDCMVEDTSGIASLDAMACITLRNRAKFKPALDASGKPVRSSWTSRFRWVMG
jgi:hypothetical protein